MFASDILKRILLLRKHHRLLNFGLAILFHTIYIISPPVLLVNAEQSTSSSKNSDFDTYFQYFQGVDGKPGSDYPVYSYIPKTSFSCKNLESGYYADLETQCQVFHICEDNKKISFLCPNGTIFQQAELICEWWNKVNCTDSPSLYEESAEKLQNEVSRRKSHRKSHTTGDKVTTQIVLKDSSTSHKSNQGRSKSARLPSNYDIERNIDRAESVNKNTYPGDNGLKSRKQDKSLRQNNHNYDTSPNSNAVTPRSKISGSSRSSPNEKQTSVQFIMSKSTNSNAFSSNSNPEDYVRFSTTPIVRTRSRVTGTYKSNVNEKQDSVSFTTKTISRSRDSGYSKSNSQDPLITNNSYVSTTTKGPDGPSARPNREEKISKTPLQNQVNDGSPSKYYADKVGQNNVDDKFAFKTSESNDEGPSPKSPLNDQYPLKITTSIPIPNPVTPQRKTNNQLDTKSSAINHKDIPEVKNSQDPADAQHPDQSDETQVPQESASFVKSSYNSIIDSSTKGTYLNHRSTYSEIRNPESYLETPKTFSSSISSITPHLVTTQPINNGKPFVGSRVGTTLVPNLITTQSKYTYLPTGRVKTEYKHSEGDVAPSTFKPLNIPVPEPGSLNLGVDDLLIPPENEPLFIKKNASLLYEGGKTSGSDDSTGPTPDYAIVYGSSTQSTVTNTYYSPTVPTVTTRVTSRDPSKATNNNNVIGRGVTVKFKDGTDKISVQLSKNVFSETQKSGESGTSPAGSRVNTRLRVADSDQFGKTSTESPTSLVTKRGNTNGFYVTKQASFGTKVERPRPFSIDVNSLGPFNLGDAKPGDSSSSSSYYSSPTFPPYQVSSAKPFELNSNDLKYNVPLTTPTPTTTQTSSSISLEDNMLQLLEEISNYNKNKYDADDSYPSLDVPPSVGPQTLHSLVQYFANEYPKSKENSSGDENSETESKEEKITSLLTAMTIHGYNHLFTTSGKTGTSASITLDEPTTTIGSISPETRLKSETRNSLDEEQESRTTNDDELITATSTPELRHLAKNFSIALSSYLHDPDNFRNHLKNLRPTEPPQINEYSEKGGNEEILKFSDQDAKPTTSAPPPSPTWGFIVAGNSDLNTANSQSFIPQFNNVAANGKDQRNENRWGKDLALNPAIINGNLKTTTPYFESTEKSREVEDDKIYTANPIIPEVDSQIKYDLRQLPSINLNSTQVHGILIDFMNHTKSHRLNRILKKLNTSEEEFLNKMKEIESNPLTKRLILLLITECGAKITDEEDNNNNKSALSTLGFLNKQVTADNKSQFFHNNNYDEQFNNNNTNTNKSDLQSFVHPKLNEHDQDARALQLLNSLYTIASKFGKK